MTLLFSSVTSYGDCVHYVGGKPILENFIYWDADHVLVPFNYKTLEENSRYLAPGIKETKTIGLEDRRMQHVEYTCEIDMSSRTTEFLLGYEPGRLTSVSEQIAMKEAETGKNVVAAVNGCFFDMEDARPQGLLVSNGKVLNEAMQPMAIDSNIHQYENIFVITNEGEAKILKTRDLCYDTKTDTYTPIKDGQFQFAINGNALVLRPNEETGESEIVYFGYEPDPRSQKHARTAIGIKDDGNVVIFSTHGKMSPFNYGYTCTELGLVMKAKGCHTAMLLDGGGSATYVSQYPGETEDVWRTFSSEGTQREVCAGILVATTASDDGVFSVEEAEVLQQGLTECDKNGHDYVDDGTYVTCEKCGEQQERSSFIGLAKDKATGRNQLLYRTSYRTGFQPYDMFEMGYYDEDGYSYPVTLEEKEMPSCTKTGFLRFSCKEAKENDGIFSFTFPKATGHDYITKDGKQICKTCGWEAADLNDCQITIANAGYTGEAKYPTITVTAPNGTVLTRKGEDLTGDFQRTVSNNVEIGMAQVTFSPITYYVNRMELRGSAGGTRTVEFPIVPYPAKSLTISNVGLDCADLSWEASASAGGDYEITYDVYVKTGEQWEKLGSTVETTYQVQGLDKATKYTFGVCATAIGKDGNIYESWSKTTKSATTLGLKTPSSVKASNVAKTGKIKVTWKSVKGADGYQVYRATKKDGKYKLVATVEKINYVDNKATTGKLYYYQVSAISNADENLNSKASDVVSRRCDLERIVLKYSNDKKTGKPKLTWTKIKGAKKYNVYRATKKDGTYQYIGTTTKTSYINKNAKKGKTYWYKVKAVHKTYSSANAALSVPKKIKCKK